MKYSKYIISYHKTRKIITEGGSFNLDLKTYLDSICIANGSTLAGRQASFKHYVKCTQKTCFEVDSLTLFMPLMSLSSEHVVLINFIFYDHCLKSENGTVIYFKDNSSIEVNVDKRTVLSQVSKCREYLSKVI